MRVLLVLATALTIARAAIISDPSDCTDYPCLIFDDEFDTFDLTAWEHEITLGGGGNWEFQGYVNNRTITYVRDGVLYVKPGLVSDWQNEEFLTSGTWDVWGGGRYNDHCTGNAFYGCSRVGTTSNMLNPIMSGRLRTLPFFGFRYGRVEVRAQMPSGAWLWPAVWMLPTYNEYGGWPASGEVDIIESRGNDDYGDLGNGYAASTLHWGADYFTNKFELTHEEYQAASGSFADDFHTWTFDWTEESMTFYLDGQQVMVVDPGTGFWDFGGLESSGYQNPWIGGDLMAPFDKSFSLIINLAVGGASDYWPDDVVGNPAKPWTNLDSNAPGNFWNDRATWLPTWQHGEAGISEQAALKVEYVKVYKLENN